MTPEEKQRIEKDAQESTWKKFNIQTQKQLDEMKDPERVGAIVGWELGYIAGATAEHERAHHNTDWVKLLKEERNKAIDECIYVLETETGDVNAIPLLESLKSDSK